MSLVLKNIDLSYQDGEVRNQVLFGASLVVPDGQVTGLIGPSGAGKSSLLSVAGLLKRQDSGVISFDGVEVQDYSESERTTFRRENIGIIFQNSNLISALTVFEQVEVMRHLSRRQSSSSKREVRERVLELLELVGLGGELDKKPRQLSGGQRQRVNIARAFMNSPKVLLVDEATSALDSKRGEQIGVLLRELTIKFNTATLMISHDPRQYSNMDSIFEVLDGRVSFKQDREAIV